MKKIFIHIKTKQLSWLLILIGLGISLFSANAVSAAYVPPVGIPAPSFGINEVAPARPSPWTSETPGYYYVNYQIGSDAGNTYGTPATPRKTIPSTLPAGSYVEVHGTYTYTAGGVTRINGAGNNSQWVANTSGPVWIVGQSISDRPSFTKRILATGSYVYFDTLYIENTGNGAFQVGSATTGYQADHIVLRNSELKGTSTNASSLVSVVGSANTPVSNIVVYNNILRDNGDINATFDQDAHASTVGNFSSYVWFLNNTIYNSSGSGAQVGGAYGGSDNVHHVYYGNNIIRNTRQAGLAVKFARDVIFSENEIYDVIDTTWSPSKGVGFQYQPDRLWILYNKIHDVYNGVRGGSSNSGVNDEVYIIGNVIYNVKVGSVTQYGQNYGNGISINNGNLTRHIINNTIFNTDRGIENGYYGSVLDIYGNILSNISDAHIYLATGYSTANNSNINNVLFSAPSKIQWGDGSIRTLAGFQTTYNKCINCQETDPLFVSTNPASADFLKLSINSSAINAGAASSVYDTFLNLYGIDIKKDIVGTTRPQGTTWDIGAYEYISGGDTTAPAAPSGLSVQ